MKSSIDRFLVMLMSQDQLIEEQQQQFEAIRCFKEDFYSLS